MKNRPEIHLIKFYYKEKHQIGIKFKYNKILIDVAKSIPSSKWNQIVMLWHLPYTTKNLDLIRYYFKDYAFINENALGLQAKQKKSMPKTERKLNEEQKIVLNNYYKYLRGKRYSDSTVKNYTFQIADFIDYHREKQIQDLCNRDVELFIEDVFIKRKLSISVQRQFISALKLFIVFDKSTQIEDIELVRPKRDKVLPTVLSQNEVIELIAKTKNLKHRTIIALLYSAGLRISELINLKIDDININRKQFIIKKAKGRKDRYAPLAEHLLPLLRNYMITYEPETYLIEGKPGFKYSSSSVSKFLHKAASQCRLKVRVTPHTLRHSYATHLLENGVGLRHIQSLLGHAKPETTMIYTHVARKDLLEIRSPLDLAVEHYKKTDNLEQKFKISEK
ncbi:tyrosine-type recombinase/integrase [Psychroserpens ponticola]|uniref:Site-specific integrase n=1 Tax=Psychroserpens ponticola TaxID=2932268 RepID=A0ABY7S6F5_9FLAO|nr:site-specific integrase [Psychroserpens ponticola]WCO03465.1 site-specific integrase [Psychroserpens ponticola]